MDEIAELSGVENGGGYLYRPDKIAQRIHFWVHTPEGESWRLRVGLWPASTAAQADAFYKAIQKGNNKGEFLSLNRQEEWQVDPNLNFSFRGTKLLWVSSPCGTPDYLDYFFSGERPYGRKQWNELVPLIEQWGHQGIIGPEDQDRIEHVRGNRTTFDINPEFGIYRDWDRDTMMRLEDQEQLPADIIDALVAPLKAWGETL